MVEQRRSGQVLATVTAGVVIGAVEVVLAISFAALVFGGYLVQYLPDGTSRMMQPSRVEFSLRESGSGTLLIVTEEVLGGRPTASVPAR